MLEKLAKSQKRKILGSFAATALLGVLVVLVAAMYFNSALGWFSKNRQVGAEGTGVRVRGMDADAKYTVYIFDAKENDVRYTGDGKEGEPHIDDMKMQVHDVIFKSRNRYTPAVVHIRLYNINSDLRRNGTVSLTITRNGAAAYETNSSGTLMLPEKSTSILRYTLANNKVSSWLGTDPDAHTAAHETYDNLDSALYERIVTNENYSSTENVSLQSAVFTTVSISGNVIVSIVKADSITLSVGYTAAQVADGTLDLFLYITYDENLVEHFEHAAGIDTDSTTVGKITTLDNDLTNLLIEFSE